MLWIRRKARPACTITTRSAPSGSCSMRDCGNPEMKDLLPDLLGDASVRAELAGARAHVASCDSCRAELAFLHQVRGAVRTPHIDTGRIAAAIPPYQRAPAWRRVSDSPVARMAAAAVLMFGL